MIRDVGPSAKVAGERDLECKIWKRGMDSQIRKRKSNRVVEGNAQQASTRDKAWN